MWLKNVKICDTLPEYYNSNLIPSLMLNEKKKEFILKKIEEKISLDKEIEDQAELKRKKLWEYQKDTETDRPSKRQRKDCPKRWPFW